MKLDSKYTVIDKLLNYINDISKYCRIYTDPFDNESGDLWTATERKYFLSDLKRLQKIILKAIKYMERGG